MTKISSIFFTGQKEKKHSFCYEDFVQKGPITCHQEMKQYQVRIMSSQFF
jgi:hypothetical protein